ncbi:uncharacterized protein LOC128241625 [Mya arenaria]|uniref:uncharacterized protein LOC128241625 n=1 Tax=Mya arenaria TaxID=6604 RepID=UPI0022E98ACF|nr:uncharacterized protein LOC128241625 [Mya arenaria]
MCDDLNQVKQYLDNLEKMRKSLCDELHQVKQDLDNSENTRQSWHDELKQVQYYLAKSEMDRMDIEEELRGTNEALNRVLRERAMILSKFPQIREHLYWTQPTVGTVRVEASRETSDYGEPSTIFLVFTFPDGIQMRHFLASGKQYTGGRFRGRLSSDHEGQLLCRMLKAAFRRGLMFILGKK